MVVRCRVGVKYVGQMYSRNEVRLFRGNETKNVSRVEHFWINGGTFFWGSFIKIEGIWFILLLYHLHLLYCNSYPKILIKAYVSFRVVITIQSANPIK